MKRALIICGMVAALSGTFLAVQTASAQKVDIYGACDGNSTNEICKNKGKTADPLIKNVVNLLLTIVGIVSLIMVIFGGLLYIMSSGDSAKLTTAKNTILYAVIGLVIALLSYAIVNFAFTELTKDAPPPATVPGGPSQQPGRP